MRARELAALSLLSLASLLAAAWAVELALPLLARDAREESLRAKEARGERVDRREKREVLAALRAEGRDAVAALVPVHLLAPAANGELRSQMAIGAREVLPFAGPAYVTTVLCNELGTWASYESDRHGFRNDSARWSAQPELALVGDSFTIGRCVADEHTIAAQLGRRHTVLNLGMGGTGPLIQLGILAEYASLLEPRGVIWVHFENDLGPADLGTERRSPLLMRYLEPGFTQGLAALQSDLDAETRVLLEQQEKHAGIPARPAGLAQRLTAVLTLRGLRERARALGPGAGASAEPDADALALYARVIERGRALVESWGGELIVAHLPRDERVAPGAPPDRQARAVVEIARRAGVAALDLGDALRAEPDPVALYAYPGGTASGPAHLNERGYEVVAEALHGFLVSH
ncbi:MAG: hypothetical protein FJ091_21180 [Deltaproteobacteria bacterium]|nr:hypothetical protein [Deltaproteobacteria bacterium]